MKADSTHGSAIRYRSELKQPFPANRQKKVPEVPGAGLRSNSREAGLRRRASRHLWGIPTSGDHLQVSVTDG